MNRPLLVWRFILILFFLIYGASPTLGVSEGENTTAETEGLDYQRIQNTQKGIPVDAHVIRRTNTLKMEFISDPVGAVRLKSVQLISPEGITYEPKEIYDVSEQAARNLGRLRPIPVPKSKKSKSSMNKIGSALLGAGLSTALSGLSSPSHSSAYHASQYGSQAAKQSSSGLSTVGLVSGLAPLALSGTGSGSNRQAKGEDVEWVEPKTAGTGIFSSVAEFECPAPSSSQEPWQLKAEMEDRKGSSLIYTFNFYPVPPLPSIWEEIQLTGPSSKLL